MRDGRPSAADEASIERGDIVVSVDRKPISSPAELECALRNQKPGVPALLKIIRGQGPIFVAIG